MFMQVKMVSIFPNGPKSNPIIFFSTKAFIVYHGKIIIFFLDEGEKSKFAWLHSEYDMKDFVSNFHKKTI